MYKDLKTNDLIRQCLLFNILGLIIICIACSHNDSNVGADSRAKLEQRGQDTINTLTIALEEDTCISVYDSPEFKLIESHWYDNLLAYFGYEGKIKEYLQAAYIVNDNNMPEQAIVYCNEALKLKKTFQAYAVKGLVYTSLFFNMNDGSGKGNDYRDKAIENYEESLRLNNEKEDFVINDDSLYYFDMCISLTRLYIEQERYERALELAQQAYQRNPKSVFAMDYISLAYGMQGNYLMAEKWANKLLDSNLDNVRAYFRLADLLVQQERYKAAARYLEKCLEIVPNEVMALNDLGYLYYYELDNEDYGIYLWKKAASLGGTYAQRNLREVGIEW